MLKQVFYYMLQGDVNVMCSNRLRGYKNAGNVSGGGGGERKKNSVEQLSSHMKSDNRISYKQPNTSTLHLFPEE